MKRIACSFGKWTVPALAAAGTLTLAASAPAVTITDDFNRAGSNDMGTTSGGGYTWVEAEPDSNNARVNNNGALIQYSSGVMNDVGVGIQGGEILNGQVEVTASKTLRGGGNSGRFGGLSYRAASAGDAANFNNSDAYYVGVRDDFSTASDVFLKNPAGDVVAEGNVGSTSNPSLPYTVRAEFDGTQHEIFFEQDQDGITEDDLAFTYTAPDSSYVRAGNVGFGVHYERIKFDNFSASGVIPEPASLALLGLGGLAMLGRRRRRRA